MLRVQTILISLALALLLAPAAHARHPKIVRAAMAGDTEQVARLIKRRVNLEKPGDNGERALVEAAARGHIDIVRLLLDAGANVYATGSGRRTALQAASQSGHLELVGLLLDAGSAIDAKGPKGHTPLHWLAKRTNTGAQRDADLAMVKLLLERGAAVNVVNPMGRSPLHGSVAAGKPEFVRVLLDNGADVNAADKFGTTALDLALQTDNTTLIEMLRDAGAEPGRKIPIDTARCPEAWGPLYVGMSYDEFKRATGTRIGLGSLSTSVMADDATGTISAFNMTVTYDKSKRILDVKCR